MDKIIFDFFCNWNTYFWMIPAWMILITLGIKLSNGKVVIQDIFMIIFAGLTNPFWNLFLVIAVPFGLVAIPAVYLYMNCWDKIKDKKIF